MHLQGVFGASNLEELGQAFVLCDITGRQMQAWKFADPDFSHSPRPFMLICNA